MKLTPIGAKVDTLTRDRLDAIQRKLQLENRSDVIKQAIAEFITRHPVSDDELARARLTGSAATPARDRAANGDGGADVIPLGRSIVLERFELDGEGGKDSPLRDLGSDPLDHLLLDHQAA